MEPRKIKMMAADPQTGKMTEVFPWSGIEVVDMSPRFLVEILNLWALVPDIRAIDVYAGWVRQWQPSEIKARRMLTGRSLELLIQDFEATNGPSADQAMPIVRGWLMDELEQRNPDAFNTWMEVGTDSPRDFFIKVWTLEQKLCDGRRGSEVPEAIWTEVCAFHASNEQEARDKADDWAIYQGMDLRDVRIRPATEHEAAHWLHDEWMD